VMTGAADELTSSSKILVCLGATDGTTAGLLSRCKPARRRFARSALGRIIPLTRPEAVSRRVFRGVRNHAVPGIGLPKHFDLSRGHVSRASVVG
jgi:hypothetical protein